MGNILELGARKSLELLAGAGFDAADFSIDGGVSNVDAMKRSNLYGLSDAEVWETYHAIGQYAQDLGIRIGQTHAAYGGYEACSSPEYLEICRKSIIATAAMGCGHIVIHPVQIPGRYVLEKKEEGMAFNLRLFGALKPTLEKYGVKNGVENMFCYDRDGSRTIRQTECSDPHDMLEYLRILGRDCFCTCPDLGHFALTEKDTHISPADCLRILGDTVEIVHLHEVDGSVDRHNIPYSYPGVMDWDDIMKALGEIGYKGIVNFESVNHCKAYPVEMLPEAYRHMAVIARHLADKIGK
ncbi:MAG: sugar phosphate isomerase/epimerase [Sphaerochaetaceae bacterium]|nr:sugar phosphate isomerase/epimerase [Sphaerochaetaceae bacterium]